MKGIIGSAMFFGNPNKSNNYLLLPNIWKVEVGGAQRWYYYNYHDRSRRQIFQIDPYNFLQILFVLDSVYSRYFLEVTSAINRFTAMVSFYPEEMDTDSSKRTSLVNFFWHMCTFQHTPFIQKLKKLFSYEKKKQITESAQPSFFENG